MKLENPNHTAMRLISVDYYLLDLDGTLYIGENLIPGAQEFIKFLQEQNCNFLILTNNSSKNRTAYQHKLDRLGIHISAEQIFTSGDATAYFLNQHLPGRRLFVVGTKYLKQLLREAGFPVVRTKPEAIVVGFDPSITYRTLWKTCDYIRSGIPYYATHPDLNCPVETGYMPDTGATLAFIVASTGRQPEEICGKPFPAMVNALSGLTKSKPENMAIVGDRLNTDIALGQFGIMTILVLSGETSPEDLNSSPYLPDLVFKDIAALHARYAQILQG